jgi:tRNA (cytidine32/uridine32-2'-O)-methyltransferase
VRLRLVLVRPLYAGNVGAVLRVAANFSVPEVVLVRPGYPPEDPDLVRMAMGAERLVEVREEDDLAAAVAEEPLVIGTTSGRSRDPRGIVTPEEARETAMVSGVGRVALVLGSERGGLKLDELRRCHLLCSVPANREFPVLNLAQAAAIMVAFLQRGSFAAPPATDPMDQAAEAQELEAAFRHVEAILLESGFLDPANPPRVMDQLRRWLGRTIPTHREVAILRGIASHIAYIWRRAGSGG